MGLRALHRHAQALKREVEALQSPTDVDECLDRYRDDPVAFVSEVLGAKSGTKRSTGEEYQFSVLRDLAKHPRVAIRSGHGVGKSALDAWATLWWLLTRPLSRVVIVAPEFQRQVRAVLFAEVRSWIRVARVDLPLEVLSHRLQVKGYGDEWGAIGLPATEPHRIEGFHAKGGVLLILDETKGIPDAVYDALQGALTGHAGNRVLVTSTPGAPSGIFHRIFSSARDDWQLHHLPASDSSLVSEDWVETRRREWGEQSPLFRARVLGEFPDDEEGSLFRLSDLEAAVDRVLEEEATGSGLAFGVDPARYGPDKTALAIWRGNTLLQILTRQGMDLMETAAWIASEINHRSPDRIRVDGIGLGAGLVDRLRQLGHSVEDVNVAERAEAPELYMNQRSEIGWRFRQALERGEVSLPNDDGLIAELSAFRYDYDTKGRIRLVKKDQTRREIGRSPDKADACLLGYSVASLGLDRFVPFGNLILDLDRLEVVDRIEWGDL